MGDRHSRSRPILALAAVLAVGALIGPRLAAAESDAELPAVKKSRAGICHEKGAVSYVQTIYFEPFESMEACLASGGRRSGQAPEGTVVAEPDRDTGGGVRRWVDSGVDWIYWLAGVVCALGVIGGFLLPHWRRWRSRRRMRDIEQRARERWQGHRLDRSDRK